MTDAFLFQTQVMLGKANERGVFLRSQMRESSDGTGSAWDTKICEGDERFPIHHLRGDMRVERAQARAFLEALRIQVSPVIDGTLDQPGDASQVVDHEVATEKREGLPMGW